MRVLIFLLFSTSFCYGQKFKEGYIILNNGDSISGLLLDKDWVKTPSQIEFQQFNGELRTFKPDEIIGFGNLETTRYISKITTINRDLYNTKQTLKMREKLAQNTLTQDTVFLETLVSGGYSLYRYVDENSQPYYFSEHENVFQELIVKRIYSEEKKTVAKLPVYQNQLLALAKNCESLMEKSGKIEFKEKDFHNFFAALNKCNNEEIKFATPPQKIETELYVSAGVSPTKVSIDYFDQGLVNIFPMITGDFPTSISPVLTLSANFVLPKNKKRWSLNIDLGYNGINTTSETGYQIKIDYLKVFTGLRFTEPKERKLFFQVGLSNSFALSHSIDGFTDNSSPRISNDAFRGHSQGLFFGAGYNFTKKISTELRIEQTNGFTSVTLISIHTLSGYMTISYRITK